MSSIEKNNDIPSHSELLLRIMYLKSEKLRQEIVLKESFTALANSFDHVSIVKRYLHEVAEDSELRLDLAKVGVNMGANFIIDKVLGKDKSIKGFISSVLIEKIAGSLINNNISSIISGFSKLVSHNTQKESTL